MKKDTSLFPLPERARSEEKGRTMEQSRIDRISELTRKSRTPEGLTEAEQAERAALRQEYIRAVLGNLECQLENTYVVDEAGNQQKLKKREGEKA